jgi:XapX domain-containing protein
MVEVFLALLVGLAIGAAFRLLKLPVPVPHGLAGLMGLVGMFAGAELVGWIVTRISSK